MRDLGCGVLGNALFTSELESIREPNLLGLYATRRQKQRLHREILDFTKHSCRTGRTARGGGEI